MTRPSGFRILSVLSTRAAIAYTIVIPVYNDSVALARRLEEMAAFDSAPEIIVVDASPDKSECRRIAAKSGVRYIEADRAGRGAQLAEGAGAATGDVLVFSHADTYLGNAHMRSLDAAMTGRRDLQAGAFYKDIARHYRWFAWATWIYRWYARRFGILYGDQSVFVRRDFYQQIGGFRSLPIMEDVEFSGRLRSHGTVDLLDPPLRTSMRKFRAEGFLKRKLRNMLLVFLYRVGVSPEKIYRWYYGNRTP